MSVKSKIVIPAAALALWGGVSVAGSPTAKAATTACGTACTNLYNADLSDNFVLDAVNQVAGVGQPVDLFAAGNLQGEDFEVTFQGRVSDFVAAGLMDPKMGTLYGNLSVYEIEWTPGGQASGFCPGVQGAPGTGTPVTLQPCGVNADTTWILDPVGSFDALINGATDHDFKHPQSMTASPTLDVSTDPLKVDKLAKGKANDQLWGMTVGAL